MNVDPLTARLVAGAFGALAWLIVVTHFGRMKGQFKRKFAIDLVGGMLAGAFLTVSVLPFSAVSIAFLVGALWARLMQFIREASTRAIVRQVEEPISASSKNRESRQALIPRKFQSEGGAYEN